MEVGIAGRSREYLLPSRHGVGPPPLSPRRSGTRRRRWFQFPLAIDVHPAGPRSGGLVSWVARMTPDPTHP